MVREMQPGDEVLLLPLGRAMASESAYFSNHNIDFFKWQSMCHKVLMDDNYQAFVNEYDGKINGMWAGAVSPVWYAHDQKVSDIVFYVAKENRGSPIAMRLLRAAEKWATSKGAKSLTIGLSSGIDTEKTMCFLKKMGYYNSTIVMEKELV